MMDETPHDRRTPRRDGTSLTTYLRYFTEPHHVRDYQREALARALTAALAPLPPGRLCLTLMDLAGDVARHGLEAAVARFVDRVLPVLAPAAAGAAAPPTGAAPGERSEDARLVRGSTRNGASGDKATAAGEPAAVAPCSSSSAAPSSREAP